MGQAGLRLGPETSAGVGLMMTTVVSTLVVAVVGTTHVSSRLLSLCYSRFSDPAGLPPDAVWWVWCSMDHDTEAEEGPCFLDDHWLKKDTKWMLGSTHRCPVPVRQHTDVL